MSIPASNPSFKITTAVQYEAVGILDNRSHEALSYFICPVMIIRISQFEGAYIILLFNTTLLRYVSLFFKIF